MSRPRVRHGARPVLASGSLLLLAMILAACGSTNVIPSPSAAVTSPSGALASSPSPSPSPSPSAAPTPSPTASALPTSSPTPEPALALSHCTGKAGGKSGPIATDTDKDYAGIQAVGATNTVSCVEATWTQPEVSCTATGPKGAMVIYVAIVGFDGKGTAHSDVRGEEVATEAYCANGTPSYDAWTSIVSSNNGNDQTPFPIHLRDQLWAQVRVSGNSFKTTMADLTTRQVYSWTATLKGVTRVDADWSVQALPGAPLAKFEPFKFTGAEAVIGGFLRTVDRWPRFINNMVSGTVKRATVSNIGSGTFTETWRHK